MKNTKTIKRINKFFYLNRKIKALFVNQMTPFFVYTFAQKYLRFI